MFFYFVIFILIILSIILFAKIEITLKKRENLILKLKFMEIKIYEKNFTTKGEKKLVNISEISIKNVVKNLGIKEVKHIAYKCFKIIISLKRRVKFKKADFNVYISDSNYVKGGYYIGAIDTMLFIGKNITDKISIHHRYKKQDEPLKIGFCVIVEFRLFKILISLIKLAIIFYRVWKKGKINYGTTSDRKFNDDCNVVN